MRANTLKTRLAGGETVFGTMMFEFLSPGLPAILENAGCDFVFYDMEHSGFTMSEIKQQLALCRGLGLTPLVRPPGKDYQFAARLLDIGAMGLLFQMVESPEEAEKLVSWTRYPLEGVRGAIFGCAHDDYGSAPMAETARVANERTMVLALIETARGLEAAHEIAAVKGVDVLHLGHADLSLSLGIPGEFDHPKLQGGIDRIIKAAQDNGKAAACLVGTPEQGRQWMGRGFRMVSYLYDMALFQSALGNGIKAMRKADG